MNSNTDSEISDIEPVDNYEEYEINELENYEKEDENNNDEDEDEEEETDEEDDYEEVDDKEKKKTEDENDEAELEDYETDIDSNEPYSEYSDSEEDIDIEQLQDNLFDVGLNEGSDSEESEVNEDNIIKEICYYQNTTHNLIPREAFKLLCDEILQDFGADYCFTKNAIDAIQVASEAYMIEILQKSNEIAVHSKRKTIQPKDVVFSKRNRTEY
jgi:histone H3/H4